MAELYTNVGLDGSSILYRGISNGKRIQKKVQYRPKLYLRTSGQTLWHTLKGQEPLEEKQFSSIYEARQFTKRYKDVSDFEIHGNQRYQYAFLSDQFPESIVPDFDLVNVGFIDIEVSSVNGFPDPAKVIEPITAITMSVGSKIHVFGTHPFTSKDPNVTCYQFDDEESMLREFMAVWTASNLDIITGWNIKLFDIPYLLNRAIKLLGHEEASMISPWGKIESELLSLGTREFQIYSIDGIAILDYIDLYKKFAPQTNQESYSLDNISEVELGERKLDYHSQGYATLEDLRLRNYQLYIDYNIRDVSLVARIDNKLRLIELAITLAYRARVNFDDVFHQTRMWDNIVHHKAKTRHLVVPPDDRHNKANQFLGAYVKEPKPGRYRKLASFDLKSLYPHLIMMYNLSPEMLVEAEDYDEVMEAFFRDNDVSIENMLARQIPTDWLKAKKLALTPNGQLFRTDRQGIMSELMEEMFNERDNNKKLMLTAKRNQEQTNDPEEKARFKKDVARYKALQQAQKVCLNSAFGALGSPWFRLFDVRVAEAITSSGQLSIRWIQQEINLMFNNLLGTSGRDYVIASDTDSIYLSMEALINKILGNETDRKKIGELMNKICDEKLNPFISKRYDVLAQYVNAYANKMSMRRESIVEQAIWTGKKHYILSVLIDEADVRYYEKPDVKITGLEAIKSAYTPKICREKLKGAYELILDGTESDVVKFVDEFRTQYNQHPVRDIAFPRGVSALSEYYQHGQFAKSCPIHVRAALVYNLFVKQHGLENKYELVKERDKIRFVHLKAPNPYQSHVIGFLDEAPPELQLTKYMDYDTQFEKTFRSPVEGVMQAVGWTLDRQDSLESFFG